MKHKIIKIIIFTILIILISLDVNAEGIEGTTIVLNPRAWRNRSRLCE